MNTEHRIFFGDSRKLDVINDESIHLVITSPPYWQLKDYEVDNQIGFNDSYEEYINNLNLVWSECYRVLHKGCRLCINIGDQFARSVYYGRYKIIPIRTEIIKFCETIGFDYMGAIIWQKVTTCNTTGGATIMGSFPYPRNGILKLDYEFILVFKKPGLPPKVGNGVKLASKMSIEEWNLYFNGHWNFAGEKQNGHIAMFPEELPKRLIKMFSFVGDTIFDPFLGSGTTALAARNEGRNSIGFEMNSQYKKHIKKKLGLNNGDLFNKENRFEFIELKQNEINLIERISKLPYKFKDPVKFNKKIDVKKLTFGSKIDSKTSNYKIDYCIIDEILGDNLLKTRNGLTLKLLGIKARKSKLNEFNNYLNRTVKGRRVILKFDNDCYDTENNLLVYMYLINKTFINAHLIKKGFAEIDDNYRISNRTLLKLRSEIHA